jgi:group I intron endonuclease
MVNDKCGIYQIRCQSSGKVYIGSSVQIYKRWYEHRHDLETGKHTNPHLQHAWTAYGRTDFEFSVVEECERPRLTEREQYYIDLLLPEFNAVRIVFPRMEASSEMREKINASLRARAALITHCPEGHEYDATNVRLSKKGKRYCLACARIWMREKLAKETPEQREQRRVKADAQYERRKHNAEWQEQERQKRLANKAEKRAYDKTRREEEKAKGISRFKTLTPEQREARRVKRREEYAANIDQRRAEQNAYHHRKAAEKRRLTA